MFGLGPQEIILISCIVILVLFGAKKIPELMSGLGKALENLKKPQKILSQKYQAQLLTKKRQAENKFRIG